MLIVPSILYLVLKLSEFIRNRMDPAPTLVDADIQAIPSLVSLGPSIDTTKIGEVPKLKRRR